MRYGKTRLVLIAKYLLACILICNVCRADAQGVVVAETVLSSVTGSTITVDITIDVSGTDPAKLLGSFSAGLRWDIEILSLQSHSGIKAPFTGVVNDINASVGQLSFNGANASGSGDISNVLSVTFDVLANGAKPKLDLEFTAMLAALDFTDLLAILIIHDGELVTSVRSHPDKTNLPDDFVLNQNFPNPFNPSTSIDFTISGNLRTTVSVDLTVYNIFGQTVKKLVNETKQPGVYSVVWDGTDENGAPAPSGVYFYRIKTAGFIATKRMLFVK